MSAGTDTMRRSLLMTLIFLATAVESYGDRIDEVITTPVYSEVDFPRTKVIVRISTASSQPIQLEFSAWGLLVSDEKANGGDAIFNENRTIAGLNFKTNSHGRLTWLIIASAKGAIIVVPDLAAKVADLLEARGVTHSANFDKLEIDSIAGNVVALTTSNIDIDLDVKQDGSFTVSDPQMAIRRSQK